MHIIITHICDILKKYHQPYEQDRKNKNISYFLRSYRQSIIQQFLHNQQVEFAINQYGKPYLIGEQLAFNHSHSTSISALVLSHHYQQIGIDVEELNRPVHFEAMAKHCFHTEEYQIWQAQGATKQHWFKIWTVKEAVLKASGLGIRLNLNELNTSIQNNTQFGQVTHPKIGFFQFYCKPCKILNSEGHTDFMLAVAWQFVHDHHQPVIRLRYGFKP